MARYVGGDFLGITFNHPTLGNFNFSTKSNESYTLDPGGKRSNDDSNGVTGNGEMIDQINAVRWSFEGVLVVDFASGNELNNLPLIAESPELGTWTFSHISGNTWRGRGKFVGDIQVDTNTAQISGKLAGGRKLDSI